MSTTLRTIAIVALTAALMAGLPSLCIAAAAGGFGPENPFFAPSALPFQAPPFDRIKDSDYQPAIEAGMAEQRREIEAIAQNPAPPTFDNTLLQLEKSGLLLDRAQAAFNAVSEANTNPTLQAAKSVLAPKLAAHHDAIYLDAKLFGRVAAIYRRRKSQNLDAESIRLVEVTYDEFVRSGANLSAADKLALKGLNEEASVLSTAFTTKLLAATQHAAFQTTVPAALSGLSDAQLEIGRAHV